ncbi:hypothetical protein BJ912DRAFT_980729, partial [Pholiota molesta]
IPRCLPSAPFIGFSVSPPLSMFFGGLCFGYVLDRIIFYVFSSIGLCVFSIVLYQYWYWYWYPISLLLRIVFIPHRIPNPSCSFFFRTRMTLGTYLSTYTVLGPRTAHPISDIHTTQGYYFKLDIFTDCG